MPVQIYHNPVSGLGTTLFEPERKWLWTWSGTSFGYRLGDGLFTLEGLQVGQFVDREVFGWNGEYMGETGPGEDAIALVTNLYKKSKTQRGFVPTLLDPAPPRAAQPPRPFYAGHEDFPAASALVSGMAASLPTEIQRALRAKRQRGSTSAVAR